VSSPVEEPAAVVDDAWSVADPLLDPLLDPLFDPSFDPGPSPVASAPVVSAPSVCASVLVVPEPLLGEEGSLAHATRHPANASPTAARHAIFAG
jgi:hypothetical protein